MSGGVGHLILSGPLMFAIPVAAAAGAVTFLSPCVLPLVPGYLSYVTGMSGVDAQDGDGPGGPASGGAGPGGDAVPGDGRPGTARSSAPCCSCSASRRCSPAWASRSAGSAPCYSGTARG